MIKPVVVRGVAIGEGIPKICVPIVGNTREEILAAAEECKELPLDVVEWRADWYDQVLELEETLETARQLRTVLGEIPLLFTFRTKKEGGEKAISTQEYEKLNIQVAESGYVDLVDVEAFTDAKERRDCQTSYENAGDGSRHSEACRNADMQPGCSDTS